MNDLTIYVSWEYFLGVVGTLIALAYYASGRFTALETDVDWIKNAISEMLISAENVRAKVFKSDSPTSLTANGYHVLCRSGLKSYIDAKRKTLLSRITTHPVPDPYELQRRAFGLLANLTFEDAVAHHLNEFAFLHGISTDLLRRIAAIYLRDIAADRN